MRNCRAPTHPFKVLTEAGAGAGAWVYSHMVKKLLLGWLQRGWTQTMVLVDFDIIELLETDVVDLTSKE